MSALSYEQATAALQRALTFGINPSLDGISALCEELGRPQDAFTVVQVAGTNGKTSTARMTHALLLGHGVSGGLYTSPELERVNERVELGAGPVTDDQFAEAVSAVVDVAERLRPGTLGNAAGFTEFELATAAGLWLFREHGVDIAVLEVGLGGRWDATSVATPAVAVVTGIGMDHAAILGDTLEQIAAEKAAIIRPGSVSVLGPGTADHERILLQRAEEVRANVLVVRENGADTPVAEDATVRFSVTTRPCDPLGPLGVDVRGLHAHYGGLEMRAPVYQAANVATAIAATEAVLGRALDLSTVREVLSTLSIPGRFEVVRSSPPVVIDGAHNPQAAATLAAAIADAWPEPGHRPAVLLGVLADKDARGIVEALAAVSGELRVTASNSPRALAAEGLAAIVESVTGRAPATSDSLIAAVAAAVASSSDGLVITGSLTTAGQARSALLDGSATA